MSKNTPNITIETPIASQSKKKALSKQPADMKKLQQRTEGKVTGMINDDKLPITKDLDWKDVSALPIFQHHKFSPIEQLIEQYNEILELIKDEKEKEKPSVRTISELQSTLFKINQTLLPYRYSKVDLVKVDSPVTPKVTVELTGLTVNAEEVTQVEM